MRRFEVLTEKPARFWEIDVVGLEVRTREGTVGRPSETRATPLENAKAVERFVAKQIEKRRAAGFVEIKRVAPGVVEDPVRRERDVTWAVGALQHYRTIYQFDRGVRVVGGHVFRKGREGSELANEYLPTIAEASVRYDALLAEAKQQASEVRGASSGSGGPVRRRKSSIESAGPARATQTASDERLEALCRAAPDEVEPWAVYADWLIARGDPRGEIAGLALGGKHDDARAALEQAFGALWEPGVALAVTLHHGFARSLFVDCSHDDLPAVARSVLGSPLACFVEGVTFHLEWAAKVDWNATLDAIVEAPYHAHLRGLHLVAGYERSETDLDLSSRWPELASLEHLTLSLARGRCELGAIDAPNLRRFERTSEGLGLDELAAIGRAKWPALDHLEIGLGMDSEARPSDDDLAPIFAARGLRALRHLGITSLRLVPATLDALVRSRLLPQLDSLDLSRAWGDGLAGELVANAEAFRHLAALELTDADLDRRDVARVRAVLDNVMFGFPANDEREDFGDDDEDDDERFDDVDE